jgi:hypothetical protein
MFYVKEWHAYEISKFSALSSLPVAVTMATMGSTMASRCMVVGHAWPSLTLVHLVGDPLTCDGACSRRAATMVA